MEANLPPPVKKPAYRKLRAYAFDPSLSLKTDTADINSMVYKVAWEQLQPGPVGEYVEVIDYDPTIGRFLTPVDLNNPYILAQDGLEPSESNPGFHQQMVYAVAMTTIQNFEKALGRKVLWAPRLLEDRNQSETYVPRLRIYPHALREANAYYSPAKKALLFGYFSATPANQVRHLPDSLVFTCLSHDIIAHEVTHAILDGMHYHYHQPSNPDVLAFHEAFADIVALFQHFTFPEVLKHQIAQTRGDLGSQNLLGKLAQEFGAAIGSYGSLRDALGSTDEKTGEWKPRPASADDYQLVLDPHGRGSILVAAVFEAFIHIYKRRVADLLRIATNGSGVLPQGELHPDLVNRLANEAAKASGHVLRMCIRALDYCPPVDITFGEYLRALITADADLVQDDSRDYRLAFIDAFRRRGIYPTGIKTLSEESLRYPAEPLVEAQTRQLFAVIADFLKEYRNEIIYKSNREEIYRISRKYIGSSSTRQGLHNRIRLRFEDSAEFEKLTGLVFMPRDWARFGLRTAANYRDGTHGPAFRVQDLRLVSRTGPLGDQQHAIIFSLVQKAGVVVQGRQVSTYVPEAQNSPPEGGFALWGGCTLIFDLESLQLRYAIAKPLLDLDKLRAGQRELDARRVLRQHRYQTEEGLSALNAQSLFFGFGLRHPCQEPFAFLHRR